MESIKSSYLSYVEDILRYGEDEHKGQSIREILGNFYYVSDPLGLSYPVRYENYTSEDLLGDIERGVFDIEGCPIKSEALLEYVRSLDEPENSQGFAYTYPDRLCRYFGVDQIQNIIDRISENLGSNRAIAITYDPRVDYDREHIPCLQSIQAVLRKRDLTIHAFFRSNDIYGAYYSNMFFLTYAGLRIVDQLKEHLPSQVRAFAGIYYYASSGHVYESDFWSARRLIKKNHKK